MTQLEKGHIVRRFDGELSHLHAMIMEMGALVLDQLSRAVAALRDEDAAAARCVIERDRGVDEANQRIDEEIIDILAKRQPVAIDLREVITIAKSVTDLERIGDLARKVARLVVKIYDTDGQTVPNPKMLQDIPYLAGLSSEMLRDSLDAFDCMDMRQARPRGAQRDREMRRKSAPPDRP